jgi:hypothetical protein
VTNLDLGWIGGSLDDTPPSDDLVPLLAQVHLLGRGCSRGVVGAPTDDAPESVSAVTLRVSEMLAALALQCALRCYVQLHQHSEAAEFVECSHF